MDEKIFEELSAELLTGRGNLFAFGGGLARGAEDTASLWNRMVTKVAATPEDQLNLDLLCGFLSELHVRDSELTDAILDEACVCPTLGRRYPFLQRAVRIDKRGFGRVMRSLALGQAPVSTYRFLSYGPVLDALAPADLRVLLNEIASKQDGIETATEVLSMRLHVANDAQRESAHDILQAGRDLMKQFELDRKSVV